MTKPVAAFLWNRLEEPGHDVCRLFRTSTGWRLEGTAVFASAGKPSRLDYGVATDPDWQTRTARVSGYVGRKEIKLKIAGGRNRSWRLNDRTIAAVAGCIDVDLGFTPATNLVALRRLKLKVGEGADAPAAYLQFPELRLVRLPQTYRRTALQEYWYESPAYDYARTLRVMPSGAVSVYPELFELVFPLPGVRSS